MRKRFIVSVDEAESPARRELQNAKFIGYAKGRRMIWWSWLPSVWLLVDESGRMTAAELRDAVTEVFDDAHCLVFELHEEARTPWAARGPAKMFQWLKNNWRRRMPRDTLSPAPDGGASAEVAPPAPDGR